MRKLAGTVGLVVAFALLIMALWPTAIGAQTSHTIPGGLYSGAVVDTSGGCSEGALTISEEISLLLNGHGTMIVSMIVTDLTTPLGDFASLDIPISVPIDDDGSFSADFDPFNVGLVMMHVEGQFEGDSVAGSFSAQGVDDLECAGTFSATGSLPPPGPPVRYGGRIFATDGDCGPGDLTMTVSGDGLSIIEIAVEGVAVHGEQAGGIATFAEGTVPIEDNGSFGWAYFPGSEPGQEIAVLGNVSMFALSGMLTVSPSTCGPMQFGGGPVFVPPSLGGPLDRGGGPRFLPATGAGSMSESGLSLGWALAAGAFGVVSLAIGAAVRRRVQ